MIVRNRRKRDSFVRRLTRSLSRIKPPAGHRVVASSTRFQMEIEKEIHRADRRGLNPEFALILFDFNDHKVNDTQLNDLLRSFEERIRVSDTIGWFDMKLAILLPETDRHGAFLVVDTLMELAQEKNVDLDATVSIYPWDDRIKGDFDSTESTRPQLQPPAEPADDRPFLSSGIDSTDFQGGTATLVEPKKIVRTQSFTTGGTGERILFSQSERTPFWKRSIDFTGAAFGLVALSPIFLATAFAIKSTSKGPVFFRQKREGKDGRQFYIYKFRTMCVNAEEQKEELRILSEQDGPAFKLKDDPRITKVGKYLRKSCIDELPQLFNVLVGNMSLVGPRPLPVNESHGCKAWQRRRLSVLPGLTCIWQARGGRDIKFSDWMRMDLEYIENRGFWNDMKILGETAKVVIMHKGSV